MSVGGRQDDDDWSHTRHPGRRATRRAPRIMLTLPDMSNPLEGGNRLLYPCPSCGVKRYEHCVEWRRTWSLESGYFTGSGYYPVEKPNPCKRRSK